MIICIIRSGVFLFFRGTSDHPPSTVTAFTHIISAKQFFRSIYKKLSVLVRFIICYLLHIHRVQMTCQIILQYVVSTFCVYKHVLYIIKILLLVYIIIKKIYIYT